MIQKHIFLAIIFINFQSTVFPLSARIEESIPPKLDSSICAKMFFSNGHQPTEIDIEMTRRVRRYTEAELKRVIDPKSFDLRYLEIGPAISPLCENCLYIEPGPRRTDLIKNLGVGGANRVLDARAERLPFKNKTIRVITMRHFPFYTNKRLMPKKGIVAGNTVSQRDLELVEVAESSEVRKRIFDELFRVLEGKGQIFILNNKGEVKSELPFLIFDEVSQSILGAAVILPRQSISIAYNYAIIAEAARSSGFKVQIVVTAKHSGLRLTKI